MSERQVMIAVAAGIGLYLLLRPAPVKASVKTGDATDVKYTGKPGTVNPIYVPGTPENEEYLKAPDYGVYGPPTEEEVANYQ